MVVVAAATDRARLRDDALVVTGGHAAAARVIRRRSFNCVRIVTSTSEILVSVGGR